MVKTIELILGLPPMKQLDLSATPMRGCFTDKPDLTPYTAVKNKIPLDEMNKPVEELDGQGEGVRAEVAGAGLRRGGPGRRGHVQPHPVVLRPRNATVSRRSMKPE